MTRRATKTTPPGRGSPRERGVALILALTSIAVLTAVSVDFSYNSRVDLDLAVNARDELRAYYLARSAVNLSRLVLRFQKQLDSVAGGLGLDNILKSLGIAAPNAPSVPGSGGLPIRLWEVVPIDCYLFQALLAGTGGGSRSDTLAPEFGATTRAHAARPVGEKPPLASFGDFDGCFHAEMQDEDQKINVNRLDVDFRVGAVAPIVTASRLFNDPRFSFVFEREDANRIKMTANEVLVALHDWIDFDENQASLAISRTGQVTFAAGFGDENRNYSRYPHRYRAKNEKFDSLDELFLVDGVSDRFMAAFRDRLTVYADISGKLNINTNDPIQQIMNILMAVENQADPRLNNLLFLSTVVQDINLTKAFLPFFGLTVQQYAAILQRNGLTASQYFLSGVTDKSDAFTIKATGTAGQVEKTLTAVVRFADARTMGKLVYWREE